MSKVDWSLAPKWAKYVVVGPLSGFKYWANDERRIQFSGDFDCEDNNHVNEGWNVVESKPQPKPWSGPEDGLPPVGSVCEVENPLEDGQWCKVKILAWDAECAVFQAEADYPYVYDGQGVEGFRPLRTPEQLRETAIRDVMDIAQVDCRVTAARLVDAGFKREVV